MNPFTYIRRNWIELLIAVVWLQSVVGAAIARDWVLFAYASLGGFLILVIIYLSIYWWDKTHRPKLGSGDAFQKPRQALILTVGRQKDVAEFLIANQKPGWLGLICSRQTEPVAELIAEFSKLGADHIQKETVDPWDILDVRDKVDVLLRWLLRKDIPPEKIVVDLTGGTTPMSVGSYDAAELNKIDSQYVRSQFTEDNRPIPGTQEGILITRHILPETPAQEE